jgi:serine/threonine protein kinase/Flp pilus assembly protein TadD
VQYHEYDVGDEIKATQSSNTFTVLGWPKEVEPAPEGSPASSEKSKPSPLLPRYEGGMGLVYKVKRETHEDKKSYALKTLRATPHWNDIERRRAMEAFKWESLVWIILGKHPNIVQAHWYDTDRYDQPMLIMELVESAEGRGVSLDKQRWWSQAGPLEERIPAVLKTGIDILDGLQYASSIVWKELKLPFVHRDIKPGNILVTTGGVAKVTDFGMVPGVHGQGMSLAVRRGISDRVSFRAIGAGGTLLYMPPEQWKELEAARGCNTAIRVVDERSDVYAIGCVLCDFLSGSVPTTPDSLEDLEQVRRERLRILADAATPQELVGILTQTLAADSDERPDYAVLSHELQRLYQPLASSARIPLRQEPLTAEDFNSRGVGFDLLDMHRKAISCYDAAIILESKKPNPEVDHRFFLNRGNAHYKLACRGWRWSFRRWREVAKARGDYLRALDIVPGLSQAFVNLGALSAFEGKFEAAIGYFTKALECNKGASVEAFCGRGNAKVQLGRIDEALKDFDAALGLQPDNAGTYVNRGNALERSLRYDEAVADYGSAICLQPDEAGLHMNRGKIYWKMDRLEEADADFKAVLAIEPTNRLARSAVRYVKDTTGRSENAAATTAS